MRRRVRVANPIDVVAVAYSLDGDDRQWLESVTRAVYPRIGDGLADYPTCTVAIGVRPRTPRRHTRGAG